MPGNNLGRPGDSWTNLRLVQESPGLPRLFLGISRVYYKTYRLTQDALGSRYFLQSIIIAMAFLLYIWILHHAKHPLQQPHNCNDCQQAQNDTVRTTAV